MIKILLRVIGLLLAVGALPAAWFGFAALDDIRGLENNITTVESQMAYNLPKAEGEKRIAENQQQIEGKKTAGYLWFGGAAGALIVGLGMVILPSSRKRKALAAEPAPPALNPQAPLDNPPAQAGQ